MIQPANPDMVLVDINMRPVNGIETTRYLLSQKPRLWSSASLHHTIIDHGEIMGITENIGNNNELGQLKTKTLGTGLEVQNFEYNIRGWLIGNNRNYLTGASSTNYFSYELAYDNNQSIISGTTYNNPQYNGNVAGLIWKVTDAANDSNTKLGDFKDGVNANDDYDCDANGNFTLDQNKSVSSILYTHLNMPYEVNITGKGKITYLFDNLGRRWKKTIVDNTTTTPTTTVWLYIGNYVYKNDVLQYFTFCKKVDVFLFIKRKSS